MSCRILVFGESCRDVFTYCTCDRLSPEAPAPVVCPNRRVDSPGMAMNVARNIRALSQCDVDVVTNDNWESITKERFVDDKSNYIMLRVDSNDSEYGRISWNGELISKIRDADCVIVSDYDKGFLHERDIDRILSLSNVSFLDTKKTLRNFALHASFIKINESEFKRSSASDVMGHLADRMIVTLGKRGARYQGKMFPVSDVEIRDVAGAGDTFISALAVDYVETRDIIHAITAANRHATTVVQKRGVCTI